MMEKSVQNLELLLQDDYIEGMGAPDMSAAIRDILTDLLHVGDLHGINIGERLVDAQDVYEEEVNQEELYPKTGVIG